MSMTYRGTGFVSAGHHFEYHPREGWKAEVRDGYTMDWETGEEVPVPAHWTNEGIGEDGM